VHVGEVAVEIKTEDDSNNMTDSLRDDQPSAGMFAFIILHSVIKYTLKDFHLSCSMLLYYIVKWENLKMLLSFHVECNN